VDVRNEAAERFFRRNGFEFSGYEDALERVLRCWL
jgi:RimJ/RimL family protein N-acetyltransferase